MCGPESQEAARTVAALLDLAAVGVEDAVAEVRVARLRPLDDQDLVAANAEVAVRDFPQLISGQGKSGARAVQHDEVVAGTLHLGEVQAHSSKLKGSRKRGARH